MRENYRKSIASIERLPQFTTMNVIDGQAGIIICSSLIFYSLTIDNILNIIVLLILAAVSIATLTGQNGILTQADKSNIENRGASVEEMKNLWKVNQETDKKVGNVTAETLEELLNNLQRQNLITADERMEIEMTGKVTIGSRTIIFTEYTTVSEVVAGAKTVEGTESDPMYVLSIEDLAILAQEISRGRTHFEDIWICLAKDLDFQDDSSYINPNATTYIQEGSEVEYGDINGDGQNNGIKTELTTGEGFLPIGSTYYLGSWKDDRDFMGNFDGKNHTISNLYINKPDSSYEVGFIGVLGYTNKEKHNSIRNLKFDNVDIKATSWVGTFAGMAYNADIVNCQVKGKVQAKYQGAAGIVGCTSDTNIRECKNYANINSEKGSDYITGIVSEVIFSNDKSKDYTIEKCFNYGTITSILTATSGGYGISGIAGMIDDDNIIVNKCINYGNINGYWYVGGIVGDNGGVVQNCYNIGSVSGDHLVGGVVGYSSNYNGATGILKNSYNIGSVTGNEKTAGIIAGGDEGAVVENSFCLSTVSSISIINPAGETSTDGMKTETDMKQDSFIELLNTGNAELVWKKDTNNINNGYPILNWQ